MGKLVTATPEELAADLRQLITGTEELMKTIREKGGSQYRQAMERIEENIQRGKDQLDDLHYRLGTRTRAIARRTDRMVHAHPWETAGTAVAAGVLLGTAIGLLIGRLMSRRGE